MTQGVYQQAKTLRGNAYREKIAAASINPNDTIKHRWMDLISITPSPETYKFFIHQMAPIYNVVALRDISMANGIWVVGKSGVVSLFISTLESIIKKVESLTSRVRIQPSKLSLGAIRAEYRYKCLNIYIEFWINRIEVDGNPHKELIKLYVRETPGFKNKIKL